MGITVPKTIGTMITDSSKMYSNENMFRFEDEILVKKYKEKRNKIFQILDNRAGKIFYITLFYYYSVYSILVN